MKSSPVMIAVGPDIAGRSGILSLVQEGAGTMLMGFSRHDTALRPPAEHDWCLRLDIPQVMKVFRSIRLMAAGLSEDGLVECVNAEEAGCARLRFRTISGKEMRIGIVAETDRLQSRMVTLERPEALSLARELEHVLAAGCGGGKHVAVP